MYPRRVFCAILGLRGSKWVNLGKSSRSKQLQAKPQGRNVSENQEPEVPEIPVEGSSPAAGDWVEFCDSIQTKLDERGRIKLPTEVREFLERKYGKEYNTFYITSIDGETAEIYPLSEWSKIGRASCRERV